MNVALRGVGEVFVVRQRNVVHRRELVQGIDRLDVIIRRDEECGQSTSIRLKCDHPISVLFQSGVMGRKLGVA